MSHLNTVNVAIPSIIEKNFSDGFKMLFYEEFSTVFTKEIFQDFEFFF